MATTPVRTGQPPGGDAPVGMGDAQIRAVLSGLMLGLLLAALDQTIVSTALPTIVGELCRCDSSATRPSRWSRRSAS